MLSFLASLALGRFLKTAGGEVKQGFSWVFSSATHVLETLLLIAIAFGAWQHHKVSGLENDLENCRLGRAADIDTWTARVKAAQDKADLAKNQYGKASHDAQTYHDQLADADQSLRDYIATHRVRPQDQASAVSAPVSGQGGSAPLHDDPAPSALVAISTEDAQRCDADYVYAQSAYTLMQKWLADGNAIPSITGH